MCIVPNKWQARWKTLNLRCRYSTFKLDTPSSSFSIFFIKTWWVGKYDVFYLLHTFKIYLFSKLVNLNLYACIFSENQYRFLGKCMQINICTFRIIMAVLIISTFSIFLRLSPSPSFTFPVTTHYIHTRSSFFFSFNLFSIEFSILSPCFCWLYASYSSLLKKKKKSLV